MARTRLRDFLLAAGIVPQFRWLSYVYIQLSAHKVLLRCAAGREILARICRSESRVNRSRTGDVDVDDGENNDDDDDDDATDVAVGGAAGCASVASFHYAKNRVRGL